MYPYENYTALVAVAQENGFLDLVEDMVNSVDRYVSKIFNMETLLPVVRFRYEGAELREKIMELDQSRKIAHDACMSYINILNRSLLMFGQTRFIDLPEDSHRDLYSVEIINFHSMLVEHGILKDTNEFREEEDF